MSENLSFVDADIPEPQNLNHREVALRQLFVSEYLVDYNATSAAIRCGFFKEQAIEMGHRLYDDPYVRQLIQKYTFSPRVEKDETEYNKTRIKEALLREAHYRGPGSSHSARVSALRELKAMYGMDQPKKVEISEAHKGGVMAVPAVTDMNEWEAAASASQDALVRHARD